MTRIYEVHYTVTLSEVIQIEAESEEDAEQEAYGNWQEYSEGLYNCEVLEERITEIGYPYVAGEKY